MHQAEFDEAAFLSAVVDRILPVEEGAAPSALGADDYVRGHIHDRGSAEAAAIAAGLAEIAALAMGRHGRGFAELDADTQHAILVELSEADWFAALTRLVAEGVYADPGNGGNRDAASWSAIGYVHGLPQGPDGPPRVAPRPWRSGGAATWQTDYDVVVVGAGASGGIVADVLSASGKSVLLLERGRDHAYADSGHRDHLRNHRHARYGHNTGPDLDGHPRVFVDPVGREHVVRPHERGYHNNASGVGSGTVLYGGMAWRFHPDDFRMASRYGVPEGSSLVDWPISYDDLAPDYERAEWEIGVSGKGGGNVHEGARTRDYPMPPLPQREAARVLSRGAVALGLSTFRPPLLINSVPRDGREACIECGSCVGFPCPSDAKSGTQNTAIPRALATGRCELVTGATVERLELDEAGRASGVVVVTANDDGSVTRHAVRARAVVLCAGAIESARLLLMSRSARFPDGIGNGHDQVGRHLQGHYYPTAFGLFAEDVHDSRGPGVTIATADFCHGNPGIVGGAMLADDFVMPPIIFWEQALPPGLPRWGREPQHFMRAHYRHVAQVKGPVHEIPDPACRVQLADVEDRWGLPVARLSGVAHAETVRTADFIRQRAEDWLRASGAARTWSAPIERRLSAGQHQAGTCRMGTDPRVSVTDSHGRVWGIDNLFVSDAALHPTNGGFNPVLTIMALAFRNARHIAQSL